MRGQSKESLLMYEAKNKPAIRDLVDRVTELTDEDIQDATVPLPWFRDALKELRDKRIFEQRSAMVLSSVRDSQVDDPEGDLVQWMGPTIFAKTSSTMSLEVTSGTWILRHSDTAWIGSTFCQVLDPKIQELPVISRMKRQQYIALYKSELQKRM